jgi:hypothetical protein
MAHPYTFIHTTARDVGTLATLGSLPAQTETRIFIVCILLCQVEKKVDGSTPGPTGTLHGNHSGGAALRGEQREQLESNHRENRAMGEESEANHRNNKHSPQMRREEIVVHL